MNIESSRTSTGLAIASGLTLLLASVAPPARATSVTVDFDLLNASSGFVSGAALDTYLAGFGVTITNVVGPSGPFVADATTAAGGLGFPNFFTPPSGPNFLWHQVANSPIAYQLNFAQPLDSLSFTRLQINAGLSPSGLIASPWSARALDGGGNTLGTVGEGQLAFFGTLPAAVFAFNTPGIAALVVERTSTNVIAGMNSVPIDDLVLTPAPSLAPEPSTPALFGLALAGIVCARSSKRRGSCRG